MHVTISNCITNDKIMKQKVKLSGTNVDGEWPVSKFSPFYFLVDMDVLDVFEVAVADFPGKRKIHFAFVGTCYMKSIM